MTSMLSFGSPATRHALGWTGATLAWLLVLYRDAAARAVQQWMGVPTYSYAFLLLPLAAGLMLRKAALGAVPAPAPAPLLVPLHLVLGLVWYLAVAIESVEVQQFCLIAGLYLVVATLFGFKVVRAQFVPLLLLAFLVPSGQFIVPLLQQTTAWLATELLIISRVPVVLDGLVIQLPEGSYEVAPGCSGLNFVLVTVVLGLTLGELFYAGWGKKLAGIALLVAAAMIANPVRVFAIILVDWLTNRSTDIVSDHLTYGWAFFALVLAAIMPLATYFRDDEVVPPPVPPAEADGAARSEARLRRRIALSAIAGLVLCSVAPLVVMAMGRVAARGGLDLPRLPATLGAGRLLRPEAWQDRGDGFRQVEALYLSPSGSTLAVGVTLRVALTPVDRLVDRLPPVSEAGPPRGAVRIVPAAGGAVGVSLSGTAGTPTAHAVCFAVAGHCQPDGDAFRRAVLRSLPADPRGPAAIVMLSGQGDAGAGNADALARDLAAAGAALAAALAPR